MLQKRFPGQRDHEEIFTVIHRHWFNILSHFVTILLLGFGTLFFFFLSPVVTEWMGWELSLSLISFITSTMLLFLWVYAFFIWIDYYFDVWVITDERILNIEQRGLFTRVISEVNLEKVQDVTTKVGGFFPTILNYGDIFIQTAGQENYFHFRNVGTPDEHKDRIVELVKKFQAQRGESGQAKTYNL
jgi:uncharacterized membrane protein YdbT with pleckstrin-like domain